MLLVIIYDYNMNYAKIILALLKIQVDNDIIFLLAIEEFEPGQDWKVAALRITFYVLAFFKG